MYSLVVTIYNFVYKEFKLWVVLPCAVRNIWLNKSEKLLHQTHSRQLLNMEGNCFIHQLIHHVLII